MRLERPFEHSGPEPVLPHVADSPFVTTHSEVTPITPASESALDHQSTPYDLTITAREAPTELPSVSIDKIREVLLNKNAGRPGAETMASFITAGMTEADILRAADYVPDLTLLRKDMETLTPRLAELNGIIAERYNDRLVLYADRDTDVSYDTHAICTPDNPAVLLPASVDLLNTLRWSGSPQLCQAFLDTFGLTQQRMRDPYFQAIIIDSGFQGSVYGMLNDIIRKGGGPPLAERGQLDIKMVATEPGRDDRLLTPLEGDESVFGADKLPRVHNWLGWQKANSLTVKNGYSPTTKLAMAMQLLPRYHGAYQNAQLTPQGLVLYTAIGEPVSQIDVPESQDADFLPTNPDLVDRTAAAFVQYGVVSAALKARSR